MVAAALYGAVQALQLYSSSSSWVVGRLLLPGTSRDGHVPPLVPVVVLDRCHPIPPGAIHGVPVLDFEAS